MMLSISSSSGNMKRMPAPASPLFTYVPPGKKYAIQIRSHSSRMANADAR